MLQIGEAYCRLKIVNSISSNITIPVLHIDTSLSFSIAKKDAYICKFEVTKITEVEKFLVSIFNSSIDIFINTFMFSSGSYPIVGNTPITSTSQMYQVESIKGLYYIGIYNNSNSNVESYSNGTITRTITFFPTVARLIQNNYHGSLLKFVLQTSVLMFDVIAYYGSQIKIIEIHNEISIQLNSYFGCNNKINLIVTELELSCDIPLLYELVDGKLPPGLQLSHDGLITGCIGCLDAMEDNKHLPPSSTWLGYNNNEWRSWGRIWNFKLKVSLNKRFFTIVNFCIRVFNNWSIEKQEFEENDFNPSEIVIDVYEKQVIHEYCIPCENSILNKNTNKITYCGECNNTQVVSDSIKIPLSLTTLNEIEIIEWVKIGIAENQEEIDFKNSMNNNYIFKTLIMKELSQRNDNSILIAKKEQVLDMKLETKIDSNDIIYKVINIINENNKYLDIILTTIVGETLICQLK